MRSGIGAFEREYGAERQVKIVDDAFWRVVQKWRCADFSDCEKIPG